MSIFGPQAGNTIDEHGVHRDSIGRQRTILDVAADAFVPTNADAAGIAAMLDRWRPTHLLEGAELDRRLATEAYAKRIVDRRRRLHDSGIVRVIQHPAHDLPLIVHEHLRSREPLEVVKTWWAEGEPVKPWLIMGGPTGTGKTWAGAWAIAESGGLYATTAEVIRAYGSLRDARGPMQVAAAEQAWGRLVNASLFVLDEFGREEWDATRPAFHELVERRGARRTLVISNVASARLREAFANGSLDRRTASRLAALALKDSAGRACWDVVGDDMRESVTEAA